MKNSLIHNQDKLNHLTSLAKSWGGDIVRMTFQSEAERMIRAPFKSPKINLGLSWTKKHVMYGYWNADRITISDIIHEMGHVFASRSKPFVSNEMSFFGWEYLMSLQVGLTSKDFYQHNKYFIVEERGYEGNFGGYSEVEKRIILELTIKRGIKYGNIVNGNPAPVR